MKKIRMSRELAYVFGLLIMPFAVAFTVKADLGMSMVAAPAYIISQKISVISYGTTEYLFQAVFLILMCIIIRKARLSFLTSFATAVVYGYLLDFAVYVTGFIPADSLFVRIPLFILGMLMTSLAVAFFFNTYLAPCAYDFFVRVVGHEKKLNMRKWKLSFDFSMLCLSIVLSLILFHKFVAISYGTFVMAAINGNIIAFFSNTMQKHIDFFDRFPLAKYFEN